MVGMRKGVGLAIAIAAASGCSPVEEWLLVAQGNRLDATSVSTKFAVSTNKSFSSKDDCIEQVYALGALGSGNVAGIIQDEHKDIRLDYFCMRIR